MKEIKKVCQPTQMEILSDSLRRAAEEISNMEPLNVAYLAGRIDGWIDQQIVQPKTAQANRPA